LITVCFRVQLDRQRWWPLLPSNYVCIIGAQTLVRAPASSIHGSGTSNGREGTRLWDFEQRTLHLVKIPAGELALQVQKLRKSPRSAAR
jgi:hypothetical protein